MLASIDAHAERRESTLWQMFRRAWSDEHGRWRSVRDEQLTLIKEHIDEAKRLSDKAERIAEKAKRIHERIAEQKQKFFALLGSIVTEEMERLSDSAIEEIDELDTMDTADDGILR